MTRLKCIYLCETLNGCRYISKLDLHLRIASRACVHAHSHARSLTRTLARTHARSYALAHTRMHTTSQCRNVVRPIHYDNQWCVGAAPPWLKAYSRRPPNLSLAQKIGDIVVAKEVASKRRNVTFQWCICRHWRVVTSNARAMSRIVSFDYSHRPFWDMWESPWDCVFDAPSRIVEQNFGTVWSCPGTFRGGIYPRAEDNKMALQNSGSSEVRTRPLNQR